MVLVPHEAYNSLLLQKQEEVPPITQEATRLNQKMVDLMNNPQIPADMKSLLFNNYQQQYVNLKKDQLAPPKDPLRDIVEMMLQQLQVPASDSVDQGSLERQTPVSALKTPGPNKELKDFFARLQQQQQPARLNQPNFGADAEEDEDDEIKFNFPPGSGLAEAVANKVEDILLDRRDAAKQRAPLPDFFQAVSLNEKDKETVAKLMDFVQQNEKHITWNKDYELTTGGKHIPRSDVMQLIKYFAKDVKSQKTPAGAAEFGKMLQQAKVPKSYVRSQARYNKYVSPKTGSSGSPNTSQFSNDGFLSTDEATPKKSQYSPYKSRLRNQAGHGLFRISHW